MNFPRWIHIECDRSPGGELESQLKDYICTLCKQGEGDQTQSCDVMDTSELIPEPGSITGNQTSALYFQNANIKYKYLQLSH